MARSLWEAPYSSAYKRPTQPKESSTTSGIKTAAPLENKNQRTLNLNSSSHSETHATYSVLVSIASSPFLSVHSQPVRVTFPANTLQITQQPRGGEVSVGGSLQLNVQATNPAQRELNYQWYKNGSPLENENQRTLILNSSSHSEFQAIYYVSVSERNAPSQSLLSQWVQVQFLAHKIEITQQPQGGNVPLEGSLQLRVEAQTPSNQGLDYQWYKDKELLAGENGNTLTLTSTSGSQYIHEYYVKVSLQGVSEEAPENTPSSSTTRAHFLNHKIEITQQPQVGEVPIGGSLELNVTATNPSNRALSYQWHRDEELLEEENARTLTLNSSSGSQLIHPYHVRISFQDENESGLDSETVNVTFKTYEIQITQQPQEGEVLVDGSLELNVTAISPANRALSYQWYRDGDPLEGENTRTLTLNSSLGSQLIHQYHVQIFL